MSVSLRGFGIEVGLLLGCGKDWQLIKLVKADVPRAGSPSGTALFLR